MFLPFPRVRGAWVALVLVALTPLSAIAVSPVKKFPKCCVWRVINAEAPVYLVCRLLLEKKKKKKNKKKNKNKETKNIQKNDYQLLQQICKSSLSAYIKHIIYTI